MIGLRSISERYNRIRRYFKVENILFAHSFD